MIIGMTLSRPTSSASVKLFLFNFCFLELQCTSLYPNDIPPLVWIFILGCTPYAASTHVNSWMRLYEPIKLLSLPFCLSNCSTCFSFDLSSPVILVTLAYSNDIAGLISGLPLFLTHSRFSNIECIVSASF